MTKQTIQASKPLPEPGRNRQLSPSEVARIRRLGLAASNHTVVSCDGTLSTLRRGHVHPNVVMAQYVDPSNIPT